VLKHFCSRYCSSRSHQPPSGGCVLKLFCTDYLCPLASAQPPSGGCVLKHEECVSDVLVENPAAFGRLCVETLCTPPRCGVALPQPPSGGCVLKQTRGAWAGAMVFQPPSGGCVLKRLMTYSPRRLPIPSRLRAAVC